MNYRITTTTKSIKQGKKLETTMYDIYAENLLDLFNSLEKLKSKHCIYNDEIVSIKLIQGEEMRYELYVLTKRNFWWLAIKTPHEEYFNYKKKNFIKDGFKVKEVIKKINNGK